VSPGEIDQIVKHGLGLRWSVIGPFETAHLNTRGGIEAHAERMGPSYARMGKERGQNDPWTAEMVQAARSDLETRSPLGAWEQRVEWRDRMIMALYQARTRLGLTPK
jgi:3-hydroxyacyl-CoA dehydrogenase